MKKPHWITATLILLTIAAVGIAWIAPFLYPARFELHNRSRQAVQITASWHAKTISIDLLQPSSTSRFCVNDEAAMVFTARFPDGRKMISREIYFSGGMNVRATITDQDIQLRYGFEG